MSKRKHPADKRIGACAEYLLGKPLSEIEFKYGFRPSIVSAWIKKTGSFKLRRPRRRNRPNLRLTPNETIARETE